MIYNYYCVNCGNENRGEDICFDLSELIGIRKDGSVADPLAMINPGVLNAHAHMSNTTLRHGVLTTIKISLKIYMTILGLNNKGRNGIGPQEMRGFKYSELEEALAQVYTSNENREAAAEKIKKLATSIRNQFSKYTGPKDAESRENTDYHFAEYYVKPFFFEDGRSDKLYTIEYANSMNDPTTVQIHAPEPIRGYCPVCGKPILINTGKYPHVLIGLLGTQKAGKTTTILALLNEIRTNFRRNNLKYNNIVLCDASYNNVQRDKLLFQKGYPPMKTNKDGTNAFNASMLLESAVTNKKKLVTFADIAGEKCYNMDTETVDLDAFRAFPLISACDVYLLCSSIDRTQAGGGQGENKSLPANAVLDIATAIYERLRNRKKIPPLCVVLTKADVTPNGNRQGTGKNPFDEIVPLHVYEYMTQYQNLSRIYDSVPSDDIREPLEWCCNIYDQMCDRTYLSMMACSALGRNANSYEGVVNDGLEPSPDGGFNPIGINHLLRWILQTVGLAPLEDEDGNYYFFPKVPSYREEYVEKSNASYYTEEESGPRCLNIPKIFINYTDEDNARTKVYMEASKNQEPVENEKHGFLSRFFN